MEDHEREICGLFGVDRFVSRDDGPQLLMRVMIEKQERYPRVNSPAICGFALKIICSTPQSSSSY